MTASNLVLGHHAVEQLVVADIALDELRLGRNRPPKPVERLSSTTTSSPASVSASTMWLPI